MISEGISAVKVSIGKILERAICVKIWTLDKEQLLAYSTDQQNLYEMAQSFGYKPKLATASQGVVDIFPVNLNTIKSPGSINL